MSLTSETLLLYGNPASEKQMETETKTCPGNELTHFWKIWKGNLCLQEMKTVLNTCIMT